MKLEVYAPTGSATTGSRQPHAPRLPHLNGKTIGEISNRLWAAERIFPRLRELLTQRYPDIKIVPYTELPSGTDGIMDNEALADLVLAKGCQAVIGASAG